MSGILLDQIEEGLNLSHLVLQKRDKSVLVEDLIKPMTAMPIMSSLVNMDMHMYADSEMTVGEGGGGGGGESFRDSIKF